MLESVTQPALPIYGNPELGGLLRREQGEHIASKIRGCASEYMEGVGHTPYQEKPAETFTYIANFLESL